MVKRVLFVSLVLFGIASFQGICLTSSAEAIPERNYKEPGDLLYSLDDGNKLIKLAEKKFGTLTEADKKLFNAVAAAEDANYAEGRGKDKPEDANSWGEERIIDANRIEWLCHDRRAKEIITDNGIQVRGARIKGVVDLSFAEVPFPLAFWGCDFNEKINIQYSRIKILGLDGSHTGSIYADGVKVEDSVFLGNGFRANGEVSFLGAVIGGNFYCRNGNFINYGNTAILAYGMDVKGSVFLNNDFKANGEVIFSRAAIGGDFYCNGGNFINDGNTAILADVMNVKDSVFLNNGFKANGEVRFPGAMIGGGFDCSDGNFINEKKIAIFAEGMDVKGNVFLSNGFKAEGVVRFSRAVIGGGFNCVKGEFINDGNTAIFADGIDVKGDVRLNNGFKANGEVRFPGAMIGGGFDCSDGNFINEKKIAIFAEGMDVKSSVFLRNGFNANGEVSFLEAAIGGDFDCSDGNFINKYKYRDAIVADGMDVKVNVYLRDGFKAEGKVSFMGATVGRYFCWTHVKMTEETILDLRNAKIGVLWDDEKSWPKKDNLFLDGFVYENIGDYAPKDANSRIVWLNRQGEKRFRPGPYEQLANVLEKIGHNEDAKMILIEKEKKITKLGDFGFWTRFWRDVLYWTIGYGYRSWWALYWILGFIVIGFGFFGIGYITGVIVPMEKDEQIGRLRKGYPKFSIFGALIYSIEMFVPVVDLRIAKYWIPDANKWWGAFVRLYMWVHISAGWILTTLLIVGLTGLVKK